MTDIVERLEQVQGDNEDAREAAAVIRQLTTENTDLREQIATCRELRKYDRIEIERLRAALQAMMDGEPNAAQLAARALEPKP